MAKDLTIRIQAKNMMARGITAAQRSLKKLSGTVVDLTKKMGKGLVAGVAGVTAGIGLAMVKAQEFNKQLAQVATVSDFTMEEAAKGVRKLSAEFGLAKDELTKGLYDALSAGVPKDNALDFLRTASKAAVAGGSSTAEAVDFLTSALNAFRLPASSAKNVADSLFATVKLGKTTVSELAASFSQVGPIAAASGVAFDQVMAAAASLTKQGTPTAQAMTQIRAAIVAMNDQLGDGWSATMTLQDGMNKMAEMAGGSSTALQALTGRVEGALAIMSMTGANAAAASRDLSALTNSANAMNEAFDKTAKSRPLDKIRQAVSNMMMVVGDKALETFGPAIERGADAIARFAETVNNWAASEKIQQIRENIDGIINAIAKGGASRSEAVGVWGAFLKASLLRGAEIAGGYLINIAPQIGKLIAAGLKSALPNVGRDISAYNQAADEMGVPRLGPFVRHGDEETRKKLQARSKQIEQEMIFKDLGIESLNVIEGQTSAQIALANATKALTDLAKENASETIAQVSETKSETIKASGAILSSVVDSSRAIEDAAESRADAEQAAIEETRDTNLDAVEDVVSAWQSAGDDVEQSIIGGFLDPIKMVASEAKKMGDSIASAKSTATSPTSGSFETVRPAGNAIPNGTRIVNSKAGISFTGGTSISATDEQMRVWEQIAQNTEGIRKDNEKLMRVG